MPLVEYEMPLVTDPEENLLSIGNSLVVKKAQPEKETPEISKTGAAAFRINNWSVGFLGQDSFQNQPIDPNFNPAEYIRDTPYMQYADSFTYANSVEQVEQIKTRIDQNIQDRKTLADAGALGVVASFVAGTLDPLNFIPLGTGVSLFRGFSVLKGAAKSAMTLGVAAGGTEVFSQLLLQQQDYTRTFGESVWDVAGSTFLGGILGGAAGAISASRFKNLSANTQKIFDIPPVDQRFHGDGITIRDWNETESFLKRESLFKPFAQATPGGRTATSRLQSVRNISRNLAENAIIYEGDEAVIAAESFIDSLFGRSYSGVRNVLKDNFNQYLSRISQDSAGPRLDPSISRGDRFNAFDSEVARAMTQFDQSDIPEVASAAKKIRGITDEYTQRALDQDMYGLKEARIAKTQRLLDKTEKQLAKVERDLEKLKSKPTPKTKKAQKRRADEIGTIENNRIPISEQRTGLLSQLDADKKWRPTIKDLQELKPNSSNSWFHRVYDLPKIRSGPKEFEKALSDYWTSTSNIPKLLADKIARDTSLKIERRGGDYQNFKITIKEKGEFKNRTLDVPDEIIAPWLVQSVEGVMRKWLRNTIADTELTRIFGDPTLESAFKRIDEEVAALEIANPEDAAKLRKTAAENKRDLAAIRDRIRGVRNIGDDSKAIYSVMRTIRNFNNARLMGSIGFNVFNDSGQIVLQNGLFKSFGSTTRAFLTNVISPETAKLVREDLKSLGVGIDATVHSRRSLYEMAADEPISGRIEELSRKAADITFKASLMANIDGISKRLSSGMAADKIKRYTTASSLKPKQWKELASLGIDKEMAARIGDQMKKYSRKQGGYNIYNFDQWTDIGAADTFAAVLKKAERVSVITPGAGDAPLFFDNPAFSLLVQYQRFMMSAVNRSLIPALQRLDAGVLAGATTMFTMGVLRETIQDLLSGRDPSQREVQEFIGRSIHRMDILGFIPNLFDNAQSLLGEGPYNTNLLLDLFGATGGLFRDIPQAAQGLKRLFTGGDVTKQQVRSLRVLLPFQNLFYINWLLTRLQEEAADRF